MTISYKKTKLRYGENPNQKAYLLQNKKKSIFDYQICGKMISYNNIIDVDSGLKCLNEFKEPTSIIIKHTNPCGVASSKDIYKAFYKSFESDRKSAFGGVVFLNRKVNLKLANYISKFFFEMVVATEYEKEAIKKLSDKKKLIILKIPKIKTKLIDKKTTLFGDLYQDSKSADINTKFIKLVSKKDASKKDIEDLLFGLKIVKHLKSNAIVLSKNKQAVGLGSGQTNRVDALNYAIKNKKKNFKDKNFVCVSDGFFPFTDSISLLKKNGCKIIAQPYGSINDYKVIAYAKRHKLSLYFTKNRLFKH
tara:strand:- start:757 stop:1674 length:918 start_codon:yes stop_codon:yes gene_type:complete